MWRSSAAESRQIVGIMASRASLDRPTPSCLAPFVFADRVQRRLRLGWCPVAPGNRSDRTDSALVELLDRDAKALVTVAWSRAHEAGPSTLKPDHQAVVDQSGICRPAAVDASLRITSLETSASTRVPARTTAVTRMLPGAGVSVSVMP